MPPLQLPILASSVVSLYFLELTDIFQPVHSGYSCNDRSLSLPYILPRQEVCPLPLLFSLAFAAPTATVSEPSTFTFDFGSPTESLWFCWASPVSFCLTQRNTDLPYEDKESCISRSYTALVLCTQILIGEAILYCYLSRRSSSTQTEANINAAGCNFNSYIRRAVRFIGNRSIQSFSWSQVHHAADVNDGFSHRRPYLWSVCDGSYNWHPPADHWSTYSLLAGCLQAQSDPH